MNTILNQLNSRRVSTGRLNREDNRLVASLGGESSLIYTKCLYFQHAHFILIVGVGNERRILIGLW